MRPSPGVFARNDERKVSPAEFAHHIAEGGQRIGVTDVMAVAAWRKVHADPVGAPDRNRGIGGVQQQPRAILDRSAVVVGALVGPVLQELVEQIAVRAVQFDAIEAGGQCIGGADAERLDDAGDLVACQRTRRDIGRLRPHEADPSGGRDCAGSHRCFAVQEQRMRDATHMPELHDDATSGLVHRARGELPSLHHLWRVDARRGGVAGALRRDDGGFGNDEAGAGPLPVILGHQRIRDATVRRPGARQRRHEDAVGKFEGAEAHGGEEVCHARLD